MDGMDRMHRIDRMDRMDGMDRMDRILYVLSVTVAYQDLVVISKTKYFDATLKYKGPDNLHSKNFKVLTAQILRKTVLTAENLCIYSQIHLYPDEINNQTKPISNS